MKTGWERFDSECGFKMGSEMKIIVGAARSGTSIIQEMYLKAMLEKMGWLRVYDKIEIV